MKGHAHDIPTLALYVHVPFCVRKCGYCDFASEARGDHLRVARYLEALAREAAGSERRGAAIATVYVGGGTPTALSDTEIERLFGALAASFDISGVSELTVEANPGTVDEGRLLRLRELGVSRLSLGVQTFDDRGLRLLGRVHDSGESVAAFRAARAAGFDDISLDLMFALPGQGLDDLRGDVARAVDLAPEHVSLYGLTYEPGTRLTRLRDEGGIVPAEEELEREMYLSVIQDLEAAGYVHYEISNFARPGFECLHNQTYWVGGEYVGLGPSAASYLAGERRKNASGVDDYVERVLRGDSAVVESERLDPEPAAREALVLALRTRRGADRDEFEARTGFSLEGLLGEEGGRLLEDHWLEFTGGRLRLTRQALPVADEVFARII